MVFSEVNLYSMARTEQYKMTIDSLTRQPLELYDMENDPDELRNLVDEPRLSDVRDQFLEEYFSHLLANLNEPQLKVYQDGGIPTKLHQEYPKYWIRDVVGFRWLVQHQTFQLAFVRPGVGRDSVAAAVVVHQCRGLSGVVMCVDSH